MLGINSVFLVGEVFEGNLNYTPKGTAFYALTVAVKRPSYKKDAQPGEFFISKYKVVAWGKRGEDLARKGLRAGDAVAIRGELRIKNEKKEENGVMYWKTDVSINPDEVSVLEGDVPREEPIPGRAPETPAQMPEEPYPPLPEDA